MFGFFLAKVAVCKGIVPGFLVSICFRCSCLWALVFADGLDRPLPAQAFADGLAAGDSQSD